MADADLILVHNPDLPGTAPTTTTELAFRNNLAPRGFVIVPPEVQTATDVLGEPVADLESLTKVQLLEVAANMGIEGVGSRTPNAEIIDAIRDGQAVIDESEE